MAWLFACFGYSKKRKRLKSFLKIHSQDKGIGSYQALESASSCLPEDSEGENPKPIRSNLKRRKQGKPKNRKKVRFDLNVIAYEPVQAYDDGDDDHDDDLRSILAAQWEQEQEEKEEDDKTDFLASIEKSTGVKRERPCSFTYRYNNCYDEEDELVSELEDDQDEVEEEEEDEEVEEELETDQELQTGRCVNPVLTPIENLNQWRAIKKKRGEIVA